MGQGYSIGGVGDGTRTALAFGWVLIIGCSSVQRQVDKAAGLSCYELADRAEATLAHRRYRSLPASERTRYESEVASCFVEYGRAERALELAAGWTDEHEVTRLQVMARAYAVLKRDDEARTALERLATLPRFDTRYFSDTAEFRGFQGRDWFVEAVVATWSRHPDQPLEKLALGLVGDKQRLLPLPLAIADVERQPGDWVLWTGLVRGSRLDRTESRTVLVAEEVELKEQLELLDRSVEAVRTRGSYTSGDYGGSFRATSVPDYRVERTYADEVKPTGRTFEIVFPAASEQVAGMSGLIAFGRYDGRSDDGALPRMRALAVSLLVPQTRTEVTRETPKPGFKLR